MIKREYMERLGLNEDQITLLTDAMVKENKYRQILCDEGLKPSLVELVTKITDVDDMDISDEKLLREKIRAEWGDLISKK